MVLNNLTNFSDIGFYEFKNFTPLNKLWFKLGIFLGNFIAPIIMGIIFFFVVTPTGIIMKLLGKDLIKLKKIMKIVTGLKKKI